MIWVALLLPLILSRMRKENVSRKKDYHAMSVLELIRE